MKAFHCQLSRAPGMIAYNVGALQIPRHQQQIAVQSDDAYRLATS